MANLQDVAKDRFRHAYALGFQDSEFTDDGERRIGDTLRRNEDFLTDSLAPSLLHQLNSLEEWTEEIVAAALLSQRYRVVKYTQPYWELLWLGVLERFQIAQREGFATGIWWRLDPAARHCATCPPKEGRYNNLVEFIEVCGGVPASFEANDDCGPGCRCWLEIEWV